jgi:hypothetical protein
MLFNETVGMTFIELEYQYVLRLNGRAGDVLLCG